MIATNPRNATPDQCTEKVVDMPEGEHSGFQARLPDRYGEALASTAGERRSSYGEHSTQVQWWRTGITTAAPRCARSDDNAEPGAVFPDASRFFQHQPLRDDEKDVGGDGPDFQWPRSEFGRKGRLRLGSGDRGV